MTNGRELATHSPVGVVRFDQAKLATLRDTIAPGLDNNEFELFGEVVRQTGLNPFSHQIYATKYGGRLAIITGIDGYRLLAERSGQYEGQAPPQWCGEDGVWLDVWLADKPPAAARVGVFRTGHREPTYAVALWTEYVRLKDGKPQAMWATMPALMLAKCAEALALRKAFPAETSGIYTEDEMDHARREARMTAAPRPKPPVGTPRQIAPATLTRDGVEKLLQERNLSLVNVADYMGIDIKDVTPKAIVDRAKDILTPTQGIAAFFDYVREFVDGNRPPLAERLEEQPALA